MKFTIKNIKLFLIILLICQEIYICKIHNHNHLQTKRAFGEFKKKFHKNYKSKDELIKFKNFQINQKKIKELNQKAKKNSSMKFGLNKFSDLSPSEFYKKYMGVDATSLKNMKNFFKKSEKFHKKTLPPNLIALKSKNLKNLNENSINPARFDLREQNAVNIPKDQGSCASCWSFASIYSLEAQFALKNGWKVRLSTQESVDCVTECDGCISGNPYYALEYGYYKGFCLEEDYPYIEEKGTCKAANCFPFVYVSDYGYDDNVDEEIMKIALLELGSYVFTLNADPLQNYIGGVIDLDHYSCDPNGYNHSVAMIGYGFDEYGYEYWIVKNSWSGDWGENGFFRIAMGFNCCGLRSYSFYSYIN